MELVNKTKLDIHIEKIVICLMAIGTVCVFSAGVNLSSDYNLEQLLNRTTLRQILFFPLAIIVLYAVSRFDYRKFRLGSLFYKSFMLYLLLLNIALLVAVLIPGVGTEVNNARRWLRFGLGPVSINFQPSELAKWTTVIFLAAVADKLNSDIRIYRKRFLPVCAVVGVIVALIVTQDLGTAAFICLVGLFMLMISGVRWWHPLTFVPFGLAAFAGILIQSPNKLGRIKAFFFSDELAGSAAYQANQSLIAIGSGGLFGKGLGHGICKYGHLPEDTTDFIFAIIGEEFGFVGCTAIIAFFVLFVWLGMLVAIRCKDRFGQLLAAGIVFTIAAQAAINIGVVTVVLPTKGISLPFVSAGGTSMLLTAAAVGLLLNIAKKGTQDEPKAD